MTSVLLDSGANVDEIYLDFGKALDTIPHKSLLMKLQAYGITDGLLTWIVNFLTGRRQQVVVNRKYSTWAKILSGIPQESIFGTDPVCNFYKRLT